MTGRWALAGVPHKGWSCVGVEDLGDVLATCSMCEVAQIRFVHIMEHEEYAESLRVGRVCAESMSEDYIRPMEWEKRLVNASRRRSRWLSRTWRISRKGNDYLNVDGYNVVVFTRGDRWMFYLQKSDAQEKHEPNRSYPTQDEAKLAAFDELIFRLGPS